MTVGKALKFSYRAIVIVMVIALIAGLLINRATEAESGSFTALSSPMSSADKKWVHETFDGYETIEELLYDGMIPFVTSNFVYDSDYNRHFLVIQQFNFNQFRQDDFHGVCYQFAQWAKSVVTELYSSEVRCYIADVRLNRNYYKTHSYNYFIVEDSNGNRETYFVDFTGILSHYRRNEPYGCCVKKIGDMPFEDYSEKVLNDEVYRVY